MCALGGWSEKCFSSARRKKENEGADWEQLRKINMWVIRKHKYWMLRVCGCERKSTQIYFLLSLTLCQSWRIYGRERRFLCIQFIAKKTATEKRKMKEFSHRSLRKKLNWKFSIIYIWGKKLFASAFALIPPFDRVCSSERLLFTRFTRWRKLSSDEDEASKWDQLGRGVGRRDVEWQSCVAINFPDIH